MPMDDRKQRVLMAIVSLYGAEGEPVGSNLLSQYFDMAVSSATLRNEMAALTKLGLLEQPHTSAGRIPTAKGYRYYVDNLIGMPSRLSQSEKNQLDEIFQTLDYDPEKLAQGAAKALSKLLGYAVVTTTPKAEDMSIAHFEVIQVGRYSAAVLVVTAAGGVRTRVAKVDFEFVEGDTQIIANVLSRHLRFIAQADIGPSLIQSMVASLGSAGPRCWPIFSAALTLLSEIGKPSVYFEGMQTLLRWAELESSLRILMELSADPKKIEKLIHTKPRHTTVMFGDELEENPIPGLSVVSRQYVAGGGLSGLIAVAGPSRMQFAEVIPSLEYFSEQLGRAMSAATP